MDNIWLTSSLWLGFALVASLISIRFGISVALVEIIIGAIGGNLLVLKVTPWISYLAGVGSILLTFLAGTEIDPIVFRKHFWSSVIIGFAGFIAPFCGALAYTKYVCGWTWQQAEIAGLALSTTSVAVVYAVMVESGYNGTEIGKIILAACFVNDLGTVLALGVLFANYNAWLALFVVVTALAMLFLPKIIPAFFRMVGNKVSEPELKSILFVLFLLGGIGNMSRSEAVLPAYLVGMVLAPYFLKEKVLAQRLRCIAFTLLTPFFFLKAGSLVKFGTIISGLGLIVVFLGLKMLTKFIGILPLTKAFKFGEREQMYTTLLMCTGLTFGSICALFGLNNHIINQSQYTILVTAVIGSAVLPTLIAQKWFQPEYKPWEEPFEELLYRGEEDFEVVGKH
jgi:Kef-type K+ transport system membrane component KefB